ncbi:MAG: hypothetical protein EA398_01995 [Deltaproteobacteria bacterium]|nr:MAG: hypothetical protein EA398_01995 [Deltaproteobacteria bacterium]
MVRLPAHRRPLLGIAAALLAATACTGPEPDPPAPTGEPAAGPEEPEPDSPAPLAVAGQVFGLPLPEGATAVLEQRALRTFSHRATIDELYAFFEEHLPGAERSALDRGIRYRVPGEEPAVFLYREARPGGTSRLAYVPRERPVEELPEPGTAEETPEDETIRIVMSELYPDRPAPTPPRHAAEAPRQAPPTAAEQQAHRERSAFREPSDYFTGSRPFTPHGYLNPADRRGQRDIPTRQHPREAGLQQQRTGPSQDPPGGYFAPSNPAAFF